MSNRIVVNLCMIFKDQTVLLGKHTRGPGVGRWNGYGGKVQGESIEESMRREIKEEADIEVGRLEKVGNIEFKFSVTGDIMECHIFRTNEFYGDPKESEEMKSPTWFRVDDMPFKDMWPDDKYWMPLMFEGKKFKGKFLLGEGDVVLEHELQEIDEKSEIKENKIKMK